MSVDDQVAKSKLLSKVLRHRPQLVGIELDAGGWVAVETLLAALALHGRPVSAAELDRIVSGTDKRRFELLDGRIRAAQGHSVPVDLQLTPVTPPAVLFHGTVAANLPGIRERGLVRARRHHVHLSPDHDTAVAVWRRKGAPVVLRVDAAGMHAAGYVFYRAANGVWLTGHVPPRYVLG